MRRLPVPLCEFMNTDDEWHAYWFGFFEACGKPLYKTPPAYVMTEQHYYNLGCARGRRAKMIGDMLCFVGAAFLFLFAILMAGHLSTWLAMELLG